jgi:hypothetical protein
MIGYASNPYTSGRNGPGDATEGRGGEQEKHPIDGKGDRITASQRGDEQEDGEDGAQGGSQRPQCRVLRSLSRPATGWAIMARARLATRTAAR